MSAPSLYVLGQRAAALDARLDTLDGVADAELAREIAALEGDLETAVEQAVKIIRNTAALAAIRRGEAARLSESAEELQRRADRLEEALKQLLIERGLKKVDAPTFTVSVVGNGGKAPLVVDEAKVPPAYMRTPPAPAPVPDKDRIRVDLERGVSLPFASLAPRGSRLVIK